MALELRQQLKLSQQLVMTPQLQQAIRLLQLSRLELVETVQRELLENPFLEEMQDEPSNEPPVEVRPESPRDEPTYDREVARSEDWEDYLGEFASTPQQVQPRDYELPEEMSSLEARYASSPTLESHLMWQLRLSSLSDDQKELGEIIKSIPSTQDIEDEKFDLDFSMFIISKEPLDKVVATVKNVSEIKDAEGEQIVIKEEETKVEEKADTAGSSNAPARDNAKPAQAKTSSKPVVNRSVRVDIEKLDVLMNLVSELIIAKNGLVASNAAEQIQHSQNFNEQIEYLERVTTNLHESVMNVRMVPIETVVNRFPRMIRDLSKKLNKKMELYMTGEDTELDRTVIDEIGDPLMHLLRNSADHGLESPEERARLGKPEVGSIFLNAYQDGNNVVIEVRDDGAGINIEKVRNKAIEKGTITPEQAESMTDKEIIEILFRPSFSTSEKITDVSGRGVGLDVVKSKIEGLGGDVECHSVVGEGSTFTIRLPLTLAIIQALMVKIGSEQYAISLGSIQTVEDIPVEEIKHVQGKEVINLRGNVIPLIRLGELLEVPDTAEDAENITVVVIKKGDKQAGLVVDSLIGQMEIVIKSLGKYININKMISGATILGDGDVALIIDANAIV